MPDEIVRIASGSAITASAMMALAVFLTLPDTADTAAKDVEAARVAPQKVFPHSHHLQPGRGIIAELDTVGRESAPRHFSAISAVPQGGLRQWQIVFQPRQEQAAPVALFLQEQPASFREATEEGTINLSPTIIETMAPEAVRRFSGRERIVQSICALAKQEARARGLALLHIDVRPAWSHEYDERTGVVIDVEIKATTDERFSYWDVVCERISQLEDSLSPEEQRFLQDQAFFVVNEG